MNLDMGLGIELGKLVPALGWVLLYFVWQGVIVGAMSAVLLWLLRHASARWRYAVCALALLFSGLRGLRLPGTPPKHPDPTL